MTEVLQNKMAKYHMCSLIYTLTYNLLSKANMIFMLSDEHHHVWCSVNHSGFSFDSRQFRSPRSKFNEAKENWPST